MEYSYKSLIYFSIFQLKCQNFSYVFSIINLIKLQVALLTTIATILDFFRALLYSIAPLILIIIMCYSMGLILYSIFYKCDPILNGEQTGLVKYDQVIIVNK